MSVPWVLVVGMHRSGTSVMAGAIAGLGATLPPRWDLVTGRTDNPVHFESGLLVAVNDALLRSLGGSWDAPPELTAGWESRAPATEHDNEARSTVARVFSAPGPNVVKDPRNCVLLPYWRRLLRGPRAVVFIWRSPAAVAASLRERDDSSVAHGLALWEHYNRSALAAMAGLPVFVMDHESLLSDPLAGCARVAEWLDGCGIAASTSRGWDVEGAAAVVSPKLRHFGSGDAPSLLPEQRELVGCLGDLDGAHPVLAAPALGPMSAWSTEVLTVQRDLQATRARLETLAEEQRQLSSAYQAIVGAHDDLARASEERIAALLQELEAIGVSSAQQLDAMRIDRDAWQKLARRTTDEIDALYSSSSWRLTAPLRSIAGAARGSGRHVPP